MKSVKVLGSGCRNCLATARLIEERAAALGVPVAVEKVTDPAAILGHGVLRTPGVVVDGTVVHAGGVPAAAAVDGWLRA
ncbi:thioredoxin family protein [Azospirillum sp. ST 5-10]|uniref:thioredoxin family protein n=1 Tax=unclassified Azospirillum TaxID=2630922 RepID=UPI003F4A234F